MNTLSKKDIISRVLSEELADTLLSAEELEAMLDKELSKPESEIDFGLVNELSAAVNEALGQNTNHIDVESKLNELEDTLFDENFGGKHGNCHLAVGASYADTFAGDVRKLDKKAKQTLGFNESALHWDLVNTEDKTVHAVLSGGQTVLIYEKGRFTR